MTYKQVVKTISKRTGITENDIRAVFSNLSAITFESADKLEPVRINGLGILDYRKYKEKRVADTHMRPWMNKETKKGEYYHGFFKINQPLQEKIHAKKIDAVKEAIK